MARKKQKREFKFMAEITGLILILLSVIGLGHFGIVGVYISAGLGLVAGVWYYLILSLTLLLGIYMIIRKKIPDFFASKIIGLLVTLTSILVLSSINYMNKLSLAPYTMLSKYIDNFTTAFKDPSAIRGGGLIGGFLTWIDIELFNIEGTRIIVIVFLICGALMFTGMSIFDIVKKAREKSKDIINHRKLLKAKDQEEIKKAEEDYEKDNKIVVSSYDDLYQKGEAKETNETENTENKVASSVEYNLPSINLLKKPANNNNKALMEEVKNNVDVLIKVLNDFGVSSKVVGINIGPAVTQYELEMMSAIKLDRIISLNKEISLAMAAKDVRIEAPIPGKRTVGIEIPNKVISTVTVREILEVIHPKVQDNKLLAVLGKNIMGIPMYVEINKTPHMLIAGATGSGKSVCINSIITSILMRAKPEEVKLVLIDPKKVELSMYAGIPHLLAPVVTDPRKANVALKKIVVEMERRYDVFEQSGNKNIVGYNMYLEKYNQTSNEKISKMPYIVVIIDELSDLMLLARKEVEDSILRITQMARAAGIHLIVATQRPSTDVITGVVKANIPTRIAFAVASSVDSMTIIGKSGAEKLLGKGDMLFLPQEENTAIRIQGAYISEEEIKRVVDFAVKQQIAQYDNNLLTDEEGTTTMVEERDADEEPLYNEIVKFVVREGKASASLIQRRFRVGYNRAARVMDLLEDRGIIGPSNGAKPREVLVEVESKEE